MLREIFPPSSCIGKGGTKRTTLEMVARFFLNDCKFYLAEEIPISSFKMK